MKSKNNNEQLLTLHMELYSIFSIQVQRLIGGHSVYVFMNFSLDIHRSTIKHQTLFSRIFSAEVIVVGIF